MRFDVVRIVIPMKPLAVAKQRLVGVVTADTRARLCLWMLGRVVQAARAGSSDAEVLVAGGDDLVAERARSLGARWEPDGGAGLNETLQSAFARAAAERCSAMLYLAGDLPYLEPGDVSALLESGAQSRLVLGPGLRGGTNAVLVSPGLPFRFQLGSDSLARHCAQARALGTDWSALRRPAVETDVDLPEDLANLKRLRPDLWRGVVEVDPRLVSSSFSLGGREWRPG